MSATETRNVTIRINGKQVANNIKSIEKEFYRTRSEVKKLQRGSQAYINKMKELRRTKAILDEHRKGVAGARKSWGGFGAMLRTQLAPLFAIGTLFNIIRNGVNTIREFGQAQADLAAVLGKSREEIIALENDAKRLGATTAYTATEVSNLQKEYAKLGFAESEILKITEPTLQLAAATGEDLAESASVAGATLRAFGLEASQMQRVVDVMAGSFSASGLDLEKWKESMKTAAPLAKAAGVSVEETAAMLGKLADSSISGSMAGTSLKKIFNELSKDGRPLNQVLADIKTQLDQAATPAEKLALANDLVGERAQAALLILADQNEAIGELKTGLDNAAGAAQKMADEQLNTLDGKLKILSSAWDGLILQFSDSESGMMAIVDIITAIVTGYQEFVKEAQANFGALGSSIDKLTESFGGVKDESAETIGVMDLVAQGVRIGTIPFNLLINTINTVVLGFRTLIEGGKAAWDFLSDFSFDDGWGGLEEASKDFGNSILEMGKTVADPFIEMFTDDFDKKLDERKEKIDDALNGNDDPADNSPETSAGRVIRTTVERIDSLDAGPIDIAREIELTKDQLMMEGLDRRREMHDEWLKEDAKKQKEQAEQTRAEWMEIFSDSLDTGFQLADQSLSNLSERELQQLEDQKQRGFLTEEQYEKKKEELQKKAFKRKQALDIAQAIINGALAITKATAQTGVLAPTVIPAIVAQTAGQVAMIAAQKYEDGGLFGLEGPSHREGGMPVIDPRTGAVRAELEGGEMIIKKSSVNASTMPVLKSINESGTVPGVNYSQASDALKFEKGGMYGSLSQSDMKAIVKSIENWQRDLNVKLSLNDLDEETERKKKVEKLAGISA